MYVYNEDDKTLLQERVTQFRSQTERFLNGTLSEEEFLPLRLQNGLYIQRLAPMLRINIPYGMVSSLQLRKLAHISRTYDKGYAHFTTRQNTQLNWPQLPQVPDILAELAEVGMHAIQSSGNCIRNITSDQLAGISPDEVADPRPWCELVRQWSTLHPEFAALPRKFKIAVSGSASDRAATQVHDIGLQLVKNSEGKLGIKILVGGGLGRTPVIGQTIEEFLEPRHLLTYLEAILRIYNRYGRRDNKYKARIKILVKAWTAEVFAQKVNEEWQHLKDGPNTLSEEQIAAFQSYFSAPQYEKFDPLEKSASQIQQSSPAFKNWLRRNVISHKIPGYKVVSLSLKPPGVAPGDVSDRQLEAIANLAERYSFGEARVTHHQNVVLGDVKQSQLYDLWCELAEHGFATPTIGSLTDMICCPGGDYCSLANAKSLPVAEAIQRHFDDLDYVHDLGDLSLNISGCMNACGHHHVGNIGILGVDKKGEEFYQVQIGGDAGSDARLGSVLGPSFYAEEIPEVIRKILDIYLQHRIEDESFIDTYHRIGIKTFKDNIYAKAA